MYAYDQQDSSIKHKLTRYDASSKGDTDQFEWPYDGIKVFIRGSFDNWTSSIPLQRRDSDGVHEVILLFRRGEGYSYKYVVDKIWKYRMDKETKVDAHGNVNNFLDLRYVRR
ncbi:MAG: hypothetical protein EZS28_019820 [Streblomastix strix]|uniref:AMP-activated protein kinase glycogen-binding domain-containing protein n=1 Tax=Streblomastix strix TaxID=222440 RepID=A0A5J4VQ10_9EUKA|nr:MAG: hypothetical protein EZS28_019820 [Streblomastix strix]